MKKTTIRMIALLCLLTLAGCGGRPGADPAVSGPTVSDPPAEAAGAVPFQEGQLYAAAYLGYEEIGDLAYYAETYLDSGELPIYYISRGDFYLIVPRYEDTALRLCRRDVETMETELVCEDPQCSPFILQCNVSDIFPDAVISLTHGEDTAEFSPYISLEDGSVQVGERGADITKVENG